MAPRKKTTSSKSKAVAKPQEPEITVSKPQTPTDRLKSITTARPTLTEDSVIILSSAENSVVDDPSLMALTIQMDRNRPHSRMSSMDMMLDDTMRAASRYTMRRSCPGNDTNTSIINVEQTPIQHRGRVKSSFFARPSRSTILGPVDDNVRDSIRTATSGDFARKSTTRVDQQKSMGLMSRPTNIGTIAEESDETANEMDHVNERQIRTRSASKRQNFRAARGNRAEVAQDDALESGDVGLENAPKKQKKHLSKKKGKFKQTESDSSSGPETEQGEEKLPDGSNTSPRGDLITEVNICTPQGTSSSEKVLPSLSDQDKPADLQFVTTRHGSGRRNKFGANQENDAIPNSRTSLVTSPITTVTHRSGRSAAIEETSHNNDRSLRQSTSGHNSADRISGSGKKSQDEESESSDEISLALRKRNRSCRPALSRAKKARNEHSDKDSDENREPSVSKSGGDMQASTDRNKSNENLMEKITHRSRSRTRKPVLSGLGVNGKSQENKSQTSDVQKETDSTDTLSSGLESVSPGKLPVAHGNEENAPHITKRNRRKPVKYSPSGPEYSNKPARTASVSPRKQGNQSLKIDNPKCIVVNGGKPFPDAAKTTRSRTQSASGKRLLLNKERPPSTSPVTRRLRGKERGPDEAAEPLLDIDVNANKSSALLSQTDSVPRVSNGDFVEVQAGKEQTKDDLRDTVTHRSRSRSRKPALLRCNDILKELVGKSRQQTETNSNPPTNPTITANTESASRQQLPLEVDNEDNVSCVTKRVREKPAKPLPKKAVDYSEQTSNNSPKQQGIESLDTGSHKRTDSDGKSSDAVKTIRSRLRSASRNRLLDKEEPRTMSRVTKRAKRKQNEHDQAAQPFLRQLNFSLVNDEDQIQHEQPVESRSNNEPVGNDNLAETVRSRTKSASQERMEIDSDNTVRGSKRAQKKPGKYSPSSNPSQAEPAFGFDSNSSSSPQKPPSRTRTRSASRGRQQLITGKNTNKNESIAATRESSKNKKSTQTRSKSVLRNAITAAPQTPSRARSIPRDDLLSPEHTRTKRSIDGCHVPIYSKQAEKFQSAEDMSIVPRPQSALNDDDDIYAFDCPVEPVTTTKKRKRLISGSKSKKFITPAKRGPPQLFAMDMNRINSVVKKIGGGPIRQQASGGSAAKSTLNTAKLAAIVQSHKPATLQASSIRSASPTPSVMSKHTNDDNDHHHYSDDIEYNFNAENIPTLDIPAPLPLPRLNPQIERIMHPKESASAKTPDKTQPNATINFSPLGASSPWRIQDENLLPKTVYFSRSKDMLPSYDSDPIVQDQEPRTNNVQQTASIATVPIKTTTPTHTSSENRPQTTVPKSNTNAVFESIQKSYNQLKVTSEMSEKLITAMRQYKTNIHRRTASLGGPENAGEEERLIAQFREYEENMKRTYQKLKQWYERSRKTLNHSVQAIEQMTDQPKTPAQQNVLDNFQRNSHQFYSMINDLQSAMNDSNIENMSPPKTVEKRSRPPFTEIIVSNRNLNNPNRSPLKALDIVHPPSAFSPVKSPLVKASFPIAANKPNSLVRSKDRFARLSLGKPSTEVNLVEDPPEVNLRNLNATSVDFARPIASPEPLPTAPTVDQPPGRDLFGFEEEVPEEDTTQSASALKITKESLKERLQSVRKLLPQQHSITSSRHTHTPLPVMFNSPTRRRQHRHIFASSTPMEKTTPSMDQPNIPPIEREPAPEKPAQRQLSPPPVVLFEEPAQGEPFGSVLKVNRTYSRAPTRNRKRNKYLADLGISDSEEELHASEGEQSDYEEVRSPSRRKQTKKRRVAAAGKKKNTVQESAEFTKFVKEFNSMCEEVNRYQLVIEKPAVPQRV